MADGSKIAIIAANMQVRRWKFRDRLHIPPKPPRLTGNTTRHFPSEGKFTLKQKSHRISLLFSRSSLRFLNTLPFRFCQIRMFGIVALNPDAAEPHEGHHIKSCCIAISLHITFVFDDFRFGDQS